MYNGSFVEGKWEGEGRWFGSGGEGYHGGFHGGRLPYNLPSPFAFTKCFRASGFGVRLLAGGERIEGTFEEVGEGRRKRNRC